MRRPGRGEAGEARIDALLVARVARHELSAPLTLQAALLSALARSGSPAGHREALHLARANVEEMLVVLDLLAHLADGGPGDHRLPLAAVLRRAVHGRQPVDVRVSRPAGAVPVDACRTAAVLTNLLDNARRHQAHPGAVAVGGCLRQGRVRLRVVHPGPCPPEVAGAIAASEPPQTRRGLGLWLVRRLVVEMAGTARVHSPVARSTWEVRIDLPAAV